MKCSLIVVIFIFLIGIAGIAQVEVETKRINLLLECPDQLMGLPTIEATRRAAKVELARGLTEMDKKYTLVQFFGPPITVRDTIPSFARPYCLAVLEVSDNQIIPELLAEIDNYIAAPPEESPINIVAFSRDFLYTNDPTHFHDPTCDQRPYMQADENSANPFSNLPRGSGNGVQVFVLDSGANGQVTSASRNLHSRHWIDDNKFYSDYGDGFNCSSHQVPSHGDNIVRVIKAIAPGSDVTMLKVCDDEGKCWTSDIIKGLLYMANQYDSTSYPDIVNMSFGSPCAEDIIPFILSIMDTTVIVSAGNNPDPIPCYEEEEISNEVVNHYPALYTHADGAENKIIAVAAGKLVNETWIYANFNTGITSFCAPGVKVLGNLTGTSYAAAYVSGLAALIVEQTGLDGFGLKIELYRQALGANSSARPDDILNNLEAARVGREGVCLIDF